ncbi:MAG: DUF2189 domain-containing protein [Rhodobacteraceae bacterium]|nr:DUF2189 domain-containing protein [Paracoccaceae bacterium]
MTESPAAPVPPHAPPSAPPVACPATPEDIRAALAAGWRDFRAAPAFGLFFAGVYVVGGLFLVWVLPGTGRVWMTIPISLGFPLLGPFVAVGLYEVSRRIEAGEPLAWGAVLGVILRQKDRQIPTVAAIIVVFFLFWNFLGHMIFALFLGLTAMTNISTSFEVYLTPNGLAMLAVGTAVGAGFALLLFATQVISLPLLLDREVDFVTAMITSVKAVLASPGVMLGWAALIAATLFVAMLPAFLGLFLALPVLGHASWHLYRRLVP